MSGSRRDNIVIGMMIILTYFLIYTFLSDSPILSSMGGLPLIECTTSLIRNGFSGSVIATLTKDFAQTILVVFVVVFVQNLLPANSSRRPTAAIGTIIGYIVIYLMAMWFIRYVVFTDRMNEIIQMFIAIFAVVFAGLGAVFSSPIRGILVQHMASEYLRNYFLNSRIMHWLADSFFISTVILFLAVAIEMSVVLPYFFTAVLAGIPAIISMIVIVAIMYYMIRI